MYRYFNFYLDTVRAIDLHACMHNATSYIVLSCLLRSVCLGAGLFFLFMLIAGTISPCFHNGCWIAKLLVFLGFIVACFFIPNVLFTVYYGIALGMSTVFLILQGLPTCNRLCYCNLRCAKNVDH